MQGWAVGSGEAERRQPTEGAVAKPLGLNVATQFCCQIFQFKRHPKSGCLCFQNYQNTVWGNETLAMFGHYAPSELPSSGTYQAVDVAPGT